MCRDRAGVRCATCGRVVALDRWHAAAAPPADPGCVYAFCDARCRAAYLAPRRGTES